MLDLEFHRGLIVIGYPHLRNFLSLQQFYFFDESQCDEDSMRLIYPFLLAKIVGEVFLEISY